MNFRSAGRNTRRVAPRLEPLRTLAGSPAGCRRRSPQTGVPERVGVFCTAPDVEDGAKHTPGAPHLSMCRRELELRPALADSHEDVDGAVHSVEAHIARLEPPRGVRPEEKDGDDEEEADERQLLANPADARVVDEHSEAGGCEREAGVFGLDGVRVAIDEPGERASSLYLAIALLEKPDLVRVERPDAVEAVEEVVEGTCPPVERFIGRAAAGGVGEPACERLDLGVGDFAPVVASNCVVGEPVLHLRVVGGEGAALLQGADEAPEVVGTKGRGESGCSCARKRNHASSPLSGDERTPTMVGLGENRHCRSARPGGARHTAKRQPVFLSGSGNDLHTRPGTTSSAVSWPSGKISTVISIKRGHHMAPGQTGASTSAPAVGSRNKRSTTLHMRPHGGLAQLISPAHGVVKQSITSAPGYLYGQLYRGTTCCSWEAKRSTVGTAKTCQIMPRSSSDNIQSLRQAGRLHKSLQLASVPTKR